MIPYTKYQLRMELDKRKIPYEQIVKRNNDYIVILDEDSFNRICTDSLIEGKFMTMVSPNQWDACLITGRERDIRKGLSEVHCNKFLLGIPYGRTRTKHSIRYTGFGRC